MNHEFFWEGLGPISQGAGELDKDSDLGQMIEKAFGSQRDFKETFSEINYSAGRDNAGAWLAFNKKTGSLEISTTRYDVLPDKTNDLVPLFTSDVWADDFYFKHFHFSRSQPGSWYDMW